MGDWVPDEDLTSVAGAKQQTSSIDTEIASVEKELAKTKDLLRIANQSLKNIDPKYQMNQSYIEKLKKQTEEYNQTIKDLETRLADLKHQKELLSSPPPAKTKPKQTTAEDVGEIVVTAPREKAKQASRRTYNPLGKFSSYTYRISLYMISQAAYAAQLDTGVWDKSGMFVVAQSAGAEANTRAPGFDLDYFIDNLEIENSMSSKDTNGSFMSTDEIKFDIFEAHGMTFLKSLAVACEKVGNSYGNVDPKQLTVALNQIYLLSVSFYGYDEKGNLVSTPTSAPGTGDKITDPGLFTRSFPIHITELHTKLDNKVVRYAIKARLVNEVISRSQQTSTIQENLNLSGSTVGDILVDGPTSLIELLNKKEEELVKAKKKSVANKFNIVFEDTSGIADSLMVDKGHYVPSQAPLNGLPGAVNVREANKGGASTVSKNKRAVQIPAGTRIMQAIEQVISQSTYITDCLSVINKEELQPVTEGDTEVIKNAKPNELAWFVIVPQVKYLSAFDDRLNSYAYEITYYVKRYEIPFVRSEYFPNRSGYKGPVKIYNYWYTGKNEGLISFDITFNNLYKSIGSMYSTGEIQNSSSAPMALVTSSGEDTAGKMPGTSEEVASLKAWLMNPDEQLTAKMKIYGDPDFLMTSSFGTFDEMSAKSIAEEDPINPLMGQVYIEIDLRSVIDFDSSGKMDPVSNYQFVKFNEEMEKQLQGRMIFGLVRVKSKFSKGMFTQEFQNMTLPPTEYQVTKMADQQTREPATSNKSPGNITSGRSTSAYSKIDPRRLDLPRPTKHDNGKPILAPVVTAEDENANKNLVGKGYNSAAQVFNKDMARIDSKSLLPKRN